MSTAKVIKTGWLILTNRNHIVTAEGFVLAELDEKIKDAEQAEIVTGKTARLHSQPEQNSKGQPKEGFGAATKQ